MHVTTLHLEPTWGSVPRPGTVARAGLIPWAAPSQAPQAPYGGPMAFEPGFQHNTRGATRTTGLRDETDTSAHIRALQARLGDVSVVFDFRIY